MSTATALSSKLPKLQNSPKQGVSRPARLAVRPVAQKNERKVMSNCECPQRNTSGMRCLRRLGTIVVTKLGALDYQRAFIYFQFESTEL